MEKIARSIAVAAPASAAFEFLADPGNLPGIWPSMVETTHREVWPDGGHRFDWAYRMAGVVLHGRAETIEVERDRLRVDRTEGGIPSTFRWTFEPGAEATQVGLEVQYELPAVFGWLAAPLLRRVNASDAETLLANLKARLEGAKDSTGPETPRQPG